MSTTLLKPQRMEIRCEGTLVVFQVGNSKLEMEYEAALHASQWLRVRAKEAKRNAGDNSRHWSAIAIPDGVYGR